MDGCSAKEEAHIEKKLLHQSISSNITCITCNTFFILFPTGLAVLLPLYRAELIVRRF